MDLNVYPQPTPSLRIAEIQLSQAVSLRGIEVSSSSDVVNLEQVINRTRNLTKRRRTTRNGTRFPEPLPHETPARKLSVEVEDYQRYRVMRGLADNTLKASKRTLTMLQAVCGDIYVSSINHAHIYKMWDLIRWAPKRRATTKLLAVRTVDDLIADGKELNLPAPAINTFRLYRRQLRAFFRAMVRHGAIASSPMEAFDDMKNSLIEDPNKPLRLFDGDELKKIFDPVGFSKWACKRPDRWWCPILGLYLGMRIGEVAQLKLADVIQDEGLWCLDIRITVDEHLRYSDDRTSAQRLKGKSAIRRLPLPQTVLDLGFLDYVDDVRQAGRLRLFPNLNAGKKKSGETRANYAGALGEQFNPYMKKLGFPDGVRFHAFRHTLVTDLKQQRYEDHHIALITGHVDGKDRVETIKRSYDHPTSPKRRKTVPVIRTWQKEVLDAYTPEVELPRYVRGQFWQALTRDGFVHP